MTHMCVTFTAEGAFLRGSNPTVIADATVAGRAVSIGAGAHGVAATVDADALVGVLGAKIADVTEAAEQA